jgi:hypothetical protein
MKSLLLSSVSVVLLSLTSEAQISLVSGVGSGGSGCPQGPADLVFNSQRKEIQIEFKNYVAVAGSKEAAKTIDRKACALTIPVSVAPGYQIALGTVTLNGGAAIASDANGVVSLEAFFAGARGEVVESQLAKGRRSFRVSSSQAAPLFAPCGQAVNLRVNTSARIQAGPSGASSAIVVRKAALRLPLLVRACH